MKSSFSRHLWLFLGLTVLCGTVTTPTEASWSNWGKAGIFSLAVAAAAYYYWYGNSPKQASSAYVATRSPAAQQFKPQRQASKPITRLVVNGTTIVIEQGDITQARVETIVNAANEQLDNGGGVCGAIFSAAGPDQLQAACHSPKNPIVNRRNVRCPVGQVRSTGSFGLASNRIQHIIHAVGPDCRKHGNTQNNGIKRPEHEEQELLRNAYQNSLIEANKLGTTSIAFPFISSAIYAFPRESAAQVAVHAIHDYLKANTTSIREVHFVLDVRKPEDFELFCKTLATIQS